MKNEKNAIIIHGGGLVDPSKIVLMRLADNLTREHVYNRVFIGKYSFEALYTNDFWLEYTPNLSKALKEKRGTFFGTSRGIDLTDSTLSKKAITCLKKESVETVIVAGGDGSSRQVAEINDTFLKEGINIIFALPLTIDGINGGESIGIKEAVRESIRQIENIVSTSLETRDNGHFGVVMVELQGRNRDDIMANVLQRFYENGKVADCDFSELLLRVVPANIETSKEFLVEDINKSSKRTLVLVSEGATIKIPELTKEINRKVRTLTIGYSSQSNRMTTKKNEKKYGLWIDNVTTLIKTRNKESFSVVKNGLYYEVKPIDYYAKLNPREGQKAEIAEYLYKLMLKYIAK